jgi:hypothetical protein
MRVISALMQNGHDAKRRVTALIYRKQTYLRRHRPRRIPATQPFKRQ